MTSWPADRTCFRVWTNTPAIFGISFPSVDGPTSTSNVPKSPKWINHLCSTWTTRLKRSRPAVDAFWRQIGQKLLYWKDTHRKTSWKNCPKRPPFLSKRNEEQSFWPKRSPDSNLGGVSVFVSVFAVFLHVFFMATSTDVVAPPPNDYQQSFYLAGPWKREGWGYGQYWQG